MFRSTLFLKILYGLLAAIGIGVLWYVVLKAYSASFTHDESFTYLGYVHEPFMDIISYKRAYTNNHILNTVLIKYSEHFFGSSELALRLPNILACLLYLIYAFKLLKRVSLVLLIPGFIMLILNVGMVDFFSLARGYGLSFAFMLMSLYHLIRYFENSSKKDLMLFNAGAFLAVLSNFSLLNFYVSALVVYNVISMINAKLNSDAPYRFFKINRIHFISLLVFIAVLYEPFRRISRKGMLDFGGKNGLLEDTFGSLIRDVLYETMIPLERFYIILALVVIMLVVIGIVIAKNIYTRNSLFLNKHRPLLMVYLTFLCIILVSVAQHLLIHNDFYTGRFALFLYPLLMLSFIYFMNYLAELHYKKTVMGISTALALLLLLNFSVNMNLHFFKEWKYDCETKAALEVLTKEHLKTTKPLHKVKLGINWLFEPTTNFYRYTHNLNWLAKTHRDGLKKTDDYYYLFQSDTNAYLAKNKPVLFSPDDTGTLLVSNKKAVGN